MSLNQESLIGPRLHADKHTVRQPIELRREEVLRPIRFHAICMKHVVNQLSGNAVGPDQPRVTGDPRRAEIVVPAAQTFGTWAVPCGQSGGFVQEEQLGITPGVIT